MIRYRFPGHVKFLHDAAARIGRPEAEGPARRVSILAALADLCAQAGGADPEHAPMILAKAEEFRDQLHAAFEAAESMLDETRRALDLPVEPARSGKPPRPSRLAGFGTGTARDSLPSSGRG